MYLSRTMRRVLKLLGDGPHALSIDDRPKHVTIRTILGLQRRGLIEHKEKWQLTAKGRDAEALVDD